MGIAIIILIDVVILILCITPAAREKLREHKRATAQARAKKQQCTRCAYSLKGLPKAATTCPECGEPILND